MPADTDHARIIEALGDSHERRLLDALQRLEERIAGIGMGAPMSDGKLFDLQYAVNARQAIVEAMTDEYLSEVDSIVRDYDRALESAVTMLNEFEIFAEVDPAIVNQLQRVSFQGFQDIASTFSDELANELYQNTLVGRSASDSIRNMRQRINGVYMQSDQVEIQRLVDLAASGDEAAASELRRVYASDRAGRNMRRYATQQVHDSLMQFDAGVNMAAARDVGAEKFKYYGSVVRDSRPWCVRHAGKTYTVDEINELWGENDWAGKAPGDPFTTRGGYNCRHHWRPSFD